MAESFKIFNTINLNTVMCLIFLLFFGALVFLIVNILCVLLILSVKKKNC